MHHSWKAIAFMVVIAFFAIWLSNNVAAIKKVVG
jgi:hypothetical protein